MTKIKSERWAFRLYVIDRTVKSMVARRNLETICDECLAGPYDIEVVDLLVHPERAARDNVVAVPTLVRVTPKTDTRMVGDLSDRARTIAWLGLDHPVTPKGAHSRRGKLHRE